ncbi:MAG: hypothetical protein M1826_006245 [Phylliscum demangeonii]|nr:MAG: hypothetical protein M1826_006245 [Phylliscum demangeonii]
MSSTATKILCLLLASSWAAPPVSGMPPPRRPIDGQAPTPDEGGRRLFGYPIKEVPPALRTPLTVRPPDGGTLSAFGRLGAISHQSEPIAALQQRVQELPHLRPRYFAYELEKTLQVKAIMQAMMVSTAFQDCMFPCLRLPMPTEADPSLRTNALAILFCGVKCQDKTGRDRDISFTRVADYLPGCKEDEAWSDFRQDHAPSFFDGGQSRAPPPRSAGAQLGTGPGPVLLPHRWVRPLLEPAWARVAQWWRGVRHGVLQVQKEVPAWERGMFAGERGVAAAGL